MTAEMVAPAWMHQQVTAQQYAAWTEEQCAGIEIVDGMVVVNPSYVLDPATGRYRDGEVFAGLVKAAVPFVVEVDLGLV